MSFLEIPVFSFVPAKYRELAEERIGRVLGSLLVFFLLLGTVNGIVSSYSICSSLSSIVSDMHDFSLKDGQLSTDKKVHMEEDDLYMDIDASVEEITEADLEDIQDDKDCEYVLIIGRNEAGVIAPGNRPAVIPFEIFKNFDLSRQSILSVYIPILRVLVIVCYFLGTFVTYLSYLIVAVLLHFITLLIAKHGFHYVITEKQSFNITVLGKFPPHVAFFLIKLLGGSLPFPLRFLLQAGFIVLIVWYYCRQGAEGAGQYGADDAGAGSQGAYGPDPAGTVNTVTMGAYYGGTGERSNMSAGKRNLIILWIALLAVIFLTVIGIGVVKIKHKLLDKKKAAVEQEDGYTEADEDDEDDVNDEPATEETEANEEEIEYDTEEVEGLITVFSGDDGFSTKLPDTVDTLWKDEYEYRGGLYVYPNDTDSMPSLEIRRFRNVGSSPEDFLENEYTAFMIRNTAGKSVPLDITDITELEEYDIGGKKLPMKEYTMEATNGDIYNVRAFAMLDKDKKTGEDVIIYFDAKNFTGKIQHEEWAMSSLDTAVQYFRLYDAGEDEEEPEDAPYDDYKSETDVSSSDYETVTSGDGLFHTSCLKSKSPEWLDEEGYWGGIGIYPDESNAYPYNQVRLYEYISNSPAEFLDTEYTGYMERLDDATDKIELADIEGPYMYETGGRRMPGILFTVKHSNGDIYKQLVLADKEKDEASGKEYLVQFCAGYFTNDEDDRDWAMEGLDAAVRGFGLE